MRLMTGAIFTSCIAPTRDQKSEIGDQPCDVIPSMTISLMKMCRESKRLKQRKGINLTSWCAMSDLCPPTSDLFVIATICNHTPY